MRQLDFFQALPPPDPLCGLAVRLPDACKCSSNVARIGQPAGPIAVRHGR
jgi:hypothetical protein